MKDDIFRSDSDALSSWEDECGTRPTDDRSAAYVVSGAGERERERERQRDAEGADGLHASHESDARGEHRYPAAHQTAAEERARHDRDALKRSLAAGRRSGKRAEG